jgi:hypothetical protein
MGKSYKQLSLVERALLQTQLGLRWSPRIAGGYRAEAAHERAARLAVKPRVVRKLVVGSVLLAWLSGTCAGA